MANRCCDLHHPLDDEPVGTSCCDPDDCGPCCDRCPTCPTLEYERAKAKFGRGEVSGSGSSRTWIIGFGHLRLDFARRLSLDAIGHAEAEHNRRWIELEAARAVFKQAREALERAMRAEEEAQKRIDRQVEDLLRRADCKEPLPLGAPAVPAPGCGVDGCNIVGPHEPAVHESTQSPEARAADYLRG